LRGNLRQRHIGVIALAPLAILFLGIACNPTNSGKRSGNSKPNTNQAPSSQNFLANLPAGLAIPNREDEVGWRVLSDYGAVLVARGGAVAPPFVVFPDAQAVDRWQAGLKTMRTDLGGTRIELQTPAMTALMEARTEAQTSHLSITPRGSDAGRRTYEETVELWASRVNPGLEHWTQEGRLTQAEAARIRNLSPREQIPEVLRLEKGGIYFSKDFAKSILYSVAAPGTSQHLSMLAFDVKEYDDASVRAILARHGWFQTVSSDTPHFTFLGVAEGDLPSLGLKKTTNAGRVFWVPRLD